MLSDKYDERSARSHVKRLVDILERPPVLTVATQSPSEETAPRSRKMSLSSQNIDQTEEERLEAKTAAEAQEQEEKMKKSYEEFYEVIRAHQGEQVQTLTPKDAQKPEQKVVSSVGELLAGSIFKSQLNKLKHLQCIESIEFSGFNPVSETRKMQGDLFYLVVRTLENPSVEVGITCSVNGFYRNESSERVSFSPAPAQRSSACFSYTLAGCLNQLSATFGRNLQTYLSSILKCEPYFISPVTQPVQNWLAAAEKPIKVSNAEGICQTISPTYGFDPKAVREWNEEFQVVRSFNSDSYQSRLQKERA